jgi:hypothetical protein
MLVKQFRLRISREATERLERLLPLYCNSGKLLRIIQRELEQRERESRNTNPQLTQHGKESKGGKQYRKARRIGNKG